jgi:ribosome-associated protein
VDGGIPVKNGIVIPEHELIITTSRASGPGGQHVNKTDTRVTLTWHIPTSSAFNDEQKARLLEKLQAELTVDGAVVVHSSASRSQLQNKKAAYKKLADKLRAALHVAKKRMKTVTPKGVQEKRLHKKKLHSQLKASRKKSFDD